MSTSSSPYKIYARITDNKALELYIDADIIVIDGENSKELFHNFATLETVDFTGFEGTFTNTYYMFNDCSALKTVDLSMFDLHNVTNTSHMFYGCTNLETVNADFSGSVVSEATYMFAECESLKSIDLSNMTLSNTNNSLFLHCSQLHMIKSPITDSDSVISYSTLNELNYVLDNNNDKQADNDIEYIRSIGIDSRFLIKSALLILKRRQLMKKKLCIILLILAALSILIVGCEKLDNITRRERTNKNTDLEIEISNSTVTVEEGDYAEVEIENFNDLKQIDIEVKDNNIIEAELDEADGTINIDCLKKGKTQIFISAKNCEDIFITVKVTKAEIEITPIESTTSNTNSTQIYEHYSAKIPYSGWSTLLGVNESDLTSKAMLDLFKDNNIAITIEMNFNIDGSGQLIFDLNKVTNQMISVLQDEDTYTNFIKTRYNEEVDEVTIEEFLSMRSEFVDILLTDKEPSVKNFNWLYEDDMLTIEYIDSTDVNSNICYVNSDGSFSYCMSDSTTWLTFEPVK